MLVSVYPYAVGYEYGGSCGKTETCRRWQPGARYDDGAGSGAGLDFDDSTIFIASLTERISFVRKQTNAGRSCQQEVLMNVEFDHDRRRKELVFRLVVSERALVATVAVLKRVLLLLGAVVATLLGH